MKSEAARLETRRNSYRVRVGKMSEMSEMRFRTGSRRRLVLMRSKMRMTNGTKTNPERARMDEKTKRRTVRRQNNPLRATQI